MLDIGVNRVVEDDSEIKLLLSFFVLVFLIGVNDVEHIHHKSLQPKGFVLPGYIIDYIPR